VPRCADQGWGVDPDRDAVAAPTAVRQKSRDVCPTIALRPSLTGLADSGTRPAIVRALSRGWYGSAQNSPNPQGCFRARVREWRLCLMLPKPPPRLGQLGFLYVPPIRVQGVSVAGEKSAVMVPEFDVCFDIGVCHRPMLASRIVALSHGHMDHVAALPYYFSQRWFQGMGTGVCVCDKRIEPAVRQMMQGWIDLEQQETSHEIIGLDEDEEFEIKNNIFLRAFAVDHTVPAMAYSVIERRTKLKPEYLDLPQSRLMELKRGGEEITREIRVPVVTYLGDTLPGAHLFRQEVLEARVLIMECTFFEPEHKARALIGKHVHLDDIVELMPHLQCEALILTHLSRRTNLGLAKRQLHERLGSERAARVHLLMDHKGNRARYEAQLEEAEAQERASGSNGSGGSGTSVPRRTATASVLSDAEYLEGEGDA